jgi:hypothetical protein
LSHDDHEDNRVGQIATKSGLVQLLGRASEAPPVGEAAPGAPKVGQTLRFNTPNNVQQRVIVCAPDDPRRSGTYYSEKHGAIPTRPLAGNRKQRRAAEAQAR